MSQLGEQFIFYIKKQEDLVYEIANLVHQASLVLKLLYPLAGNAKEPAGK